MAEQGVRVDRPTRLVALRLRNLDESVTPDDVSRALSEVEKCPVTAIKTGPLCIIRSGLLSIWARVPADLVASLREAGRLRFGWASSQIEFLAPTPQHCYKCLLPDNVRSRCPVPDDIGSACYRCAADGHIASACEEALKCPACSSNGLPNTHRLGCRSCKAPITRGKPLPTRQIEASAQQLPAPVDEHGEAEVMIL